MTVDVWLVDLAALAVIAWIVWFFWLSGKTETLATTVAGGMQEVHVKVKGGYDPDLVVAEAGRPVRLLFHRQETAACSEMVQFPDFDISRHLPTGETVVIDIEDPEPGEYEFACQMGMLRGKLVVTSDGRP